MSNWFKRKYVRTGLASAAALVLLGAGHSWQLRSCRRAKLNPVEPSPSQGDSLSSSLKPAEKTECDRLIARFHKPCVNRGQIGPDGELRQVLLTETEEVYCVLKEEKPLALVHRVSSEVQQLTDVCAQLRKMQDPLGGGKATFLFLDGQQHNARVAGQAMRIIGGWAQENPNDESEISADQAHLALGALLGYPEEDLRGMYSTTHPSGDEVMADSQSRGASSRRSKKLVPPEGQKRSRKQSLFSFLEKSLFEEVYTTLAELRQGDFGLLFYATVINQDSTLSESKGEFHIAGGASAYIVKDHANEAVLARREVIKSPQTTICVEARTGHLDTAILLILANEEHAAHWLHCIHSAVRLCRQRTSSLASFDRSFREPEPELESAPSGESATMLTPGGTVRARNELWDFFSSSKHSGEDFKPFNHVLLTGWLSKKSHHGTTRNNWTKRYFVLGEEVGSGELSLRYHKDEECEHPKGEILLQGAVVAPLDTIEALRQAGMPISSALKHAGTYMFQCQTESDKMPLFLKADDDSERQRWIACFRENGVCVEDQSYMATVLEEKVRELEVKLRHARVRASTIKSQSPAAYKMIPETSEMQSLSVLTAPKRSNHSNLEKETPLSPSAILWPPPSSEGKSSDDSKGMDQETAQTINLLQEQLAALTKHIEEVEGKQQELAAAQQPSSCGERNICAAMLFTRFTHDYCRTCSGSWFRSSPPPPPPPPPPSPKAPPPPPPPPPPPGKGPPPPPSKPGAAAASTLAMRAVTPPPPKNIGVKPGHVTEITNKVKVDGTMMDPKEGLAMVIDQADISVESKGLAVTNYMDAFEDAPEDLNRMISYYPRLIVACVFDPGQAFELLMVWEENLLDLLTAEELPEHRRRVGAFDIYHTLEADKAEIEAKAKMNKVLKARAAKIAKEKEKESQNAMQKELAAAIAGRHSVQTAHDPVEEQKKIKKTKIQSKKKKTTILE
ncbi:hypothetical protein CYMTET_49695 [Cymbomonas tetramitiformis]|uniref:PH domain-containing protein n=1 Tax=Cymbomonas tetramitiformis TaxID=36881 RepID=A0AAE0BPP9_9CHLO|nr:hypothetical protein CYMTET_49695 [Cymbomonas tetramitiformis]